MKHMKWLRCRKYMESANSTKIEIEQHLEESLISQDDYEKLKQENERYRQELHVLRFNLTAHEAAERDHQEFYEALENKFKYLTMIEKEQKDLIDRYTAEKEEYEIHIADLKAEIEKNDGKIKQLQIEEKKYTDHLNDRLQFSKRENFRYKRDLDRLRNFLCDQDMNIETLKDQLALMEDVNQELRDNLHITQLELARKDERDKKQYKQDIQKLRNLLWDKDKNIEELKDRLANMEDISRINQELSDNLHITREELARKEKELGNAVETAEELSTNLRELELSKITPACDTCKGNSLFAEVEDRRTVLLDKMELYVSKYNDILRLLNTKIALIEILRAKWGTMSRKLEKDMIDTFQENVDLLNEYKRRIFELEDKLKFQIIKSNQTEEAHFTDDFHYVRSLITAKGKEIEQLIEKIVKQAMQILVQEETNHSISKELRYWRSKAMYLETENLAIKTQLEKEQINDDANIYLEDIENCKISDNENFEKICDHSQLIPDKGLENNYTYQRGSTEISKKPIMDTMKMCSKIVCFTKNTDDIKDVKDTDNYTYQRGSTEMSKS